MARGSAAGRVDWWGRWGRFGCWATWAAPTWWSSAQLAPVETLVYAGHVAKVALNVKVDPEAIERLDRIASAMAERSGGADVTRSDAGRTVIAAGIPVVEERMGIAAKPTKGGAKSARKPKT